MDRDSETIDVFAPDAREFVPHDPRAGALAADDGAGRGRGDDVALTDDVEDDGDDVVVLSWWQNPINAIALVVATALIGGMVGWLIADANSDRRGNDVDVGFLQDMRFHHEQAVTMSFIYLDHADVDPLLRVDARSIAFGQGIEIGRMIQILREMNQPEGADPDEPGTAMAWMGDGMAMNHDQMPGLATEDELNALRNAEGDDADELFVELMVAHHQGGLEMADYAAEHASSGEVRRFASSIAGSQRDEIIEMQNVIGG